MKQIVELRHFFSESHQLDIRGSFANQSLHIRDAARIEVGVFVLGRFGSDDDR
jgi:hypothetical protein